MLFFYSGYILSRVDGRQLASSHGSMYINDIDGLVIKVGDEMIRHYTGRIPEGGLNVHIIALNRVD